MDMDSKEQLLQSAIPLFADYGFDKVSIRQLAKAAGVNSALISYYFGSKQGLYQAVINKQVSGLMAFTAKTRQAELDPVAVLRLYAATMLELHTKNPYFIRLCYREFITPSVILDDFSQNHLKFVFLTLSAALRQGINSGQFRPDLDVNGAVLLLAGMVNFYFFSQPVRSRVLAGKDIDAKTYIDQTVAIFLAGIQRRDSHDKE